MNDAFVDATSGLQKTDGVAGQKGQVWIHDTEVRRILRNGRGNRQSAKYEWFSTMRKRAAFAPKDFRELLVHPLIVALNRA